MHRDILSNHALGMLIHGRVSGRRKLPFLMEALIEMESLAYLVGRKVVTFCVKAICALVQLDANADRRTHKFQST